MITAVMAAAVPLLLASLGGLISERAGVLNIALEGCMTAGAFTTAVLVESGLPAAIAVPAAGISGILLGWLLGTVHLRLKANIFIAGLGINLLVPSLTGLLSQALYGHKGNLPMPERVLSAFAENWILPISILTLLLVPAAILLLHRTPTGRNIRAAGRDNGFLAERGLRRDRIRLLALMISSSAAAVAGGYISLRIGAWVPGLIAGRGWIALVIIWLGFKRPTGILLAAYFFSLTEIISGRLQGVSGHSSTLFLALPYLMALIALVFATLGHGGRNSEH